MLNLPLDGTTRIAARRNPDKVVILLVGNSGHGKSKTINRLVGRDLLQVGRSILGSTTNAIQRVEVPVSDEKEGTKINSIAFDDTPGFDDTTYNLRHTNALLMSQYKAKYFPDSDSCPQSSPFSNSTFPHVILLVATWDSITPDAHNDPPNFTSAIGKSISNLKNSRLVDLEYSNIIVVVTKSMSYWYQLDDYESQDEKKNQWCIEADVRKAIILDLQRRAFPKSTPWPVVFVENGGGSKMDGGYPILPNGEQSHQNLFDTISNVMHDLAGVHALRVLAGAGFLDSVGRVETLLSPEMIQNTKSTTLPNNPLVHPPSDRFLELADEYLGVAYNPVRGTFGRTSILRFKPSDIRRSKPKDLISIQQKNDPTALLLNTSGFPISASLSSHYSSSLAFNSAKSEKSQVHLFRVATAVMNFSASSKVLSDEMMTRIDQLPPIPNEPAETNEVMEQYYDFFETHGTHVVLQVVLGGLLRIVVQEINTDGGSSEKCQVAIFRDGGSAVASRLTLALENYLRDHSLGPHSTWTNICMPWVKEVENDPVFCPDDESTKYCWLYELHGLDKRQKADLKRASESYLASRQIPNQPTNSSGVPGELKSIDRPGNLAKVLQKLENLLKIFKGSNPAILLRQLDEKYPVSDTSTNQSDPSARHQDGLGFRIRRILTRRETLK